MKEKIIKDPIYGYISFPEELVNKVLNTPQFQRLRDVIQTSYSSLYSSAVHNRFVHSLGVYYLGKLASESLIREIRKNHSQDICKQLDSDEHIFLLSCLLHDVGHAPFSHTGEYFYLGEENSYDLLYKKLLSCVKSERLKKDVESRAIHAAPHEVMSSIVGVSDFNSCFRDDEEKEFFVRCITGYLYPDSDANYYVKNCFISLLNSHVIDVDKLDYLIRDSYFSGFCSVQIDYCRLLNSITIKQIKESSPIEIAYKKAAISVLESVVYAHDYEKKWIQTHHVITYDSFLLKRILQKLSNDYSNETGSLFSYDALTEEGLTLKDGTVVRLFSDSDVINLMKRHYNDYPEVKEYFDRRKRKHALWKSETELNALEFSVLPEGVRTSFNKVLSEIVQYQKKISNYLINKDVVSILEQDLEEINKSCQIDDRSIKVQKDYKNDIILFMRTLINEAEKSNYKGDFVLLESNPFNSSFLKPDFSQIQIQFDTSGEKCFFVDFKYVAKPLTGFKGKDNEEFFYLYYDGSVPLDTKSIFRSICDRLSEL